LTKSSGSETSGEPFQREAIVAILSDDEALWIVNAWDDTEGREGRELLTVAMASRLVELGVRPKGT